jgi:hypothetical protein
MLLLDSLQKPPQMLARLLLVERLCMGLLADTFQTGMILLLPLPGPLAFMLLEVLLEINLCRPKQAYKFRTT